MTETKFCKRCTGKGKLLAVGPVQGDKHECWVCAGKGYLPKPDKLVLISQAINKAGNVHGDRPKLNHKMALDAIGKPSTWGRIPTTYDDVQVCWRASPDGRRAFFVWKRLRMALGIDRSTHNTVDMRNTVAYDPWVSDLEYLVEELAKARKK